MVRILAAHAERAGGGLSTGTIVLYVLLGLAIAVVLRLAVRGMDRTRIAGYARDNGWELLECRWAPFGPGWFASGRSRIYRIAYRDREGRTQRAFVKTSALGGVYLTQDQAEG